MAASSNDSFGQELLLALHKEGITKPEHSCVVYIHWALLRCGLKCIGLGDDKEITGEETGTEVLPTGWNTGPNYLLRYSKDKKLFILRVNAMGDDAIISLIRADDMKITSIIHPLQAAKDEDWKKLTAEVKKDLLEPLVEQAKPKREAQSPLRDFTFRPPPRSSVDPFGGFEPGFVDVGRTDLDPLGRFGLDGPSGMLLRPRHRGTYPGARFDPILPGLGPRGNPPGPDPDHFRPPDFPPSGFYM